MPSNSLLGWTGDRESALDRLEAVHLKLTKGLRGRRYDTVELNHALFLRLASEIQGFCRDLHDECVGVVATPVNVPSADLRRALRLGLERDRGLDKANAGPGVLGNDFNRFGLNFWDAVEEKFGERRTKDWNHRLDWLNTARNGIAHNDPVKIAAAHAEFPLTLATFKNLRRRLRNFASAADKTMESYLVQCVGLAPW